MSKSIVVYGVSDMTGETVARILRAASAQFPASEGTIKVLRNATSAEQVVSFIQQQGDDARPCAVFHTILSKRVRKDLRNALQALRIPSVDLLGSTAHVMADLLGEHPQTMPGITIEDGAQPTYHDLVEDK